MKADSPTEPEAGQRVKISHGSAKRLISDLAADPENPRRIADEALAGLAASAEEFGDLSGIVWNRRTGFLVAGHQRMKVLRRAGAKEWTLDEEGGDSGWIAHPKTGERFPVRVVDWDAMTAMAAGITANNPEIQGEFSGGLKGQLVSLKNEAKFAELRLKELLGDGELEASVVRTLEDFDTTPPPKRAWILIATSEEKSPEIEARLRELFEGPDVRIEVSVGQASEY